MKQLRLVSVLLAVVVSMVAEAQGSITGRVIDEQSQPMPFVNVVLVNRADSAFITGAVTKDNGTFAISTDKQDGLVKVSSVGYIIRYIDVRQGNLGDIQMQPDVQTLGEVVVKSSLPITKLEGNALVTSVKGSVLERIGTAKDVLGRLPGIIVEQGNVSVFGKGTPAIYINGQLVRNENMLDQLQSVKIKKVELITNPGARYDATVSSVIRITAERNPGEGFSIDSKTTIGYRNYLSLSEQVDLNYRCNDLDVFAMLEYDRSKTKGSSANTQNSWLAQHYLQDIAMNSHARKQLYEGKLGFNYSITPNHILGIYYQATHKPIKIKSLFDSESWIDNALYETSEIEKQADSKTPGHLVDGYYTGMLGKWSLDATFDLLWKKSDNNDCSDVIFGSSQHQAVTIDDKSTARLMAGEIHASHPLWKGNIAMGLGYSSSRRSEESVNLEQVLANTDDEVREDNIAAYIETAQRLGRINLQLGMRFEHIDSRYYDDGIKMGEQSRIYDNLFPTASITLPIKKSVLMLNYSKKYERPLYSQLSGAVSYVNRYLFQSGNPLLKSQYNDHLSLTFRYQWLILMANYIYTDGKIIDECLPYGNDGTITLLRKNNSSSALHKYQLMAVVAPHFGNYYPNLMLGVIGQDYHIDYLGVKKTFNKPMLMVRWNNLLRLKQGYMVNLDMTWRSSGDSENIRLGQIWSLNSGVTKQFGRHWNVKLSVNDLFNASKKNDFTIYSGVSDVQMIKRATSRNIECTVRYNFNTTKSKYAGKGAGNTEKNRL